MLKYSNLLGCNSQKVCLTGAIEGSVSRQLRDRVEQAGPNNVSSGFLV